MCSANEKLDSAIEEIANQLDSHSTELAKVQARLDAMTRQKELRESELAALREQLEESEFKLSRKVQESVDGAKARDTQILNLERELANANKVSVSSSVCA